MVEELEEIKDENKAIVDKLKEIGKKFLKEYVIKIGDLTIEPLWVEAYFLMIRRHLEIFLYIAIKIRWITLAAYISTMQPMIPEVEWTSVFH